MRTFRWITIIAVGVLVVAAVPAAADQIQTQPSQDLKQSAAQIETLPDSEPATPATASTATFVIPWSSINSGGQPSGSASFTLNGSVGQAAIGEAGSATYDVGVGYWYGAVAGGGGCACDCHADPQCDGVTNVLDVVHGVNVAFRGGAPIIDPNPMCPYENTDVNCSGFTDVIDVVKLVNVAFRSGDPAVEFCDACP